MWGRRRRSRELPGGHGMLQSKSAAVRGVRIRDAGFSIGVDVLPNRSPLCESATKVSKEPRMSSR